MPTTVYIFFFNDTATTEIYTLSLHDALPISAPATTREDPSAGRPAEITLTITGHRNYAGTYRAVGTSNTCGAQRSLATGEDRKSTRLNSSHANISYAVFCLKKKTTTNISPLR